MKILVDYDNLPNSIARQGLAYLADRVVSNVTPVIGAISGANVRLYGGWDQNNRLTRQAQDLSSEIRTTFPKGMKIGGTPVIFTMQLARSLEAIPHKVLPNTMRSEPARRIRCLTPSSVTCRNSQCPLDPMAAFLNSEKCPIGGCQASPAALLSRVEQKLVDTHLVADLIYAASRGETPIGIVSSDDDMWPGILSALQMGITVAHLRAAISPAVSPYFVNTPGEYHSIGL